ncbi:MAG TPA: UDP-N-acetylmuramyl-tripeptide synthetase [Candidatus Saccharimonadales bacterium]|nr:UDP-N-acetylmuramyl-tripeptide synthetase [Candidatus Saccharimonadales bacterium]
MWQATKNIYHFNQAIVANIIYGFPARGMKIIGVTGTDGKTTTANLIYHVLHVAGEKAAVISSVGATIDGEKFDTGFHITTPGRFDVQSYLKRAKKLGVKYIVLEVTSHALDQHRVQGVHIDVGVVTNITREHLDYHKTYEKYVTAKAKLLKKAKIAIVNKDDRSYQLLKKHHLKNRYNEVMTYGMKKDSDMNPHVFPFQTKLLGTFNKYNCLAAISVLQALHIPDTAIRKGLLTYKPPVGRQEIVYNKDFMVINDFAHTPNSFSVILPESKRLAKNKLIHVFGSAAKRDAFKRPEMGKFSSKYADIIVLTSEDPRDEPIENIYTDILKGIKNFEVVGEAELRDQKFEMKLGKKYLFKIPDRKEAIHFAIRLAKKGDVVLLTGKGHEKSINYGKGEEPWDETKTAKEAIEMRNQG